MKPLNGLITLNKPQWMTSRQVVTRISAILRKAGYGRQIRVGHCGTLDPMASGVLVICIGKSTRLVKLIQDQKKTYAGKFQLGRVTSTDDFTGETLSESDVTSESVTSDMINTLLPEFRGSIEQVPPKFSAIHINGKRAYKLARQGREVELSARIVRVHRLELTSLEIPDFELQIECGSGTYIRSIGRDIGKRLGCGATMKALTRSAIGSFTIEHAIEPDQITPDNIASLVQPPINAVLHLPRINITDAQKRDVYDGRPIVVETTSAFADDEARPKSELQLILVGPDHKLVAVASFRPLEGTAKPDMVFHDPPREH
ncbi:MAG: tRNA pseudouridine(55) synthase TruB [Planctomycetota bacterium]|nr:tRNA pseudouridine(55) synthase TruB [Planctomycetota bacterium]